MTKKAYLAELMRVYWIYHPAARREYYLSIMDGSGVE